jgi:F-type H+-transporting ATPase subunit epsilon
MAERLQFELVSPERLLFSRAVDMAVVPGVEGDFGAMLGHAPFLSVLRPGVIAVFEGAQVVERLFVAGGFAEVTARRCTVLAEEAISLADIDRVAVETALRHARDDLGEAKTEVERAAIENRIAVAEAKLASLERPPY